MINAVSDVVIGLQYGDEGKGKAVDHLVKSGFYNLCLRYNGGPNAGHTVYVDGKKMATHQVPSGALTGIMSVIDANCMVDPVKLEAELAYIKDELPYLDIYNLVKVSKHCNIITAKHIAYDKVNDKVGTTHSGMTPAYVDKYNRTGQRAGDYDHPIFERIELVDTFNFINNNYPEPKIIFEGAQGYELDVNSDTYPYVTSTHCTSAFAFTGGVSIRSLRNVWGIAKLYVTYVGSMEFQPDDPIFTKLQELGHEFGVTTGRARQTNWLDLDKLYKAVVVNSVNKLLINKADIIRDLGVYRLFHQGELYEFTTFDKMLEYVSAVFDGVTEVIFSYSPERI